MNLGLLIIIISLLGSASNWLNWRFLNYKIIHLLYYLGAFIHECSHALLCLLTGAKIVEFSAFSKQPHVSYYKSKLPILGSLLISLAPIIGGLFFLFIINKYYFQDYFVIPQLHVWQDIFAAPIKVLFSINLLSWKNWIMIFFFLNIGAMIGPSWQDLKNIWLIIIVLFFFNYPVFDYLGLLVIVLILTNILIQIILILVIEIVKNIYHHIAFNK
ncbi:MAG: M50 family metallopeptidase [Candidatus Staskawiczbacteria bacterium]|nr:M50 family metallopeptidase [Candidatus Staskawiczbacteria bacterium]